jgi:hypothetical protein
MSHESEEVGEVYFDECSGVVCSSLVRLLHDQQ